MSDLAVKFGPGQSRPLPVVLIIPEGEVRQSLEKFVVLAGSAKALAKQWNISQQYLCDLRKGRRAFTDDILEKMNYKRVITFKTFYKTRQP